MFSHRRASTVIRIGASVFQLDDNKNSKERDNSEDVSKQYQREASNGDVHARCKRLAYAEEDNACDCGSGGPGVDR